LSESERNGGKCRRATSAPQSVSVPGHREPSWQQEQAKEAAAGASTRLRLISLSRNLRVAALAMLQHCMLTGPDCGARAMVDCSQFAGIFEGFGCCSNRDDVDRTVSLCNPPGVSKTDQQAPQTRCGVGITFRASSGGLKVYRSSSTLAFFAL